MTNQQTHITSRSILLWPWTIAMLLMIGWVVTSYEIESQLNLSAWYPVMLVGFLVNAILPKKHRTSFFIGIFLFTAIYLFGFKDGGLIIGISLFLIGVTNAPVSRQVRGILLALIGLFLAFTRSGVFPIDVSTNVQVIVASLFMFRLVIFLYDSKHAKTPFPLKLQLSYFLMLPNLVFPLFPVVDLKAFQRSFYSDVDLNVYRRGVLLMARGIFHLLLYRLIYLYGIPELDQIDTASASFQYIVVSYLLILRLSGIFHFVVGSLCLFGYNLPEIFNNYFLADGFDDYWRRINIYWKDFMLKVFYYPIYFKVKKMGTAVAVALTTFVVFGITWFFHAYQWFWILGSYEFRATDNFFWLSFGVLVTYAAYRTAIHKGPKRMDSFVSQLGRSFRIIGTFLIAAILWSIWVSPEFSNWFHIVDPLLSDPVSTGMILIMVVLATVLLALGLFIQLRTRDSRIVHRLNSLSLYPFYTFLICTLTLLNTEYAKSNLDEHLGWSYEEMTTSSLNINESREKFHGYYEEVLEGNSFIKNSWSAPEENNQWELLNSSHAIRKTNDFLVKALNPNIQIEFKNSTVSTNSWGIRDKEYDKERVPGTVRVALIGGSIEMGSGVNDDEVFESVLEDSIVSTFGENSYESLNFSIGSRSLIQNVYYLENKILNYDPTHLIIVHHDWDWEVTLNLFVKVISGNKIEGNRFPYQYLNDLVSRTGLEKGVNREILRERLDPLKLEIFKWAYERIEELTRERGIEVIWVHLPEVGFRTGEKFDLQQSMSIAREVGFSTHDLSHIYEGIQKDEIMIDANDNHPNALGHQMIANNLYPIISDLITNTSEID